MTSDSVSGQIAWRLGGRHSSFTMGPGTPTAWQHDPRELPDGSISIFDNGASPKRAQQSRGIVVSLDAAARRRDAGRSARARPLAAARRQPGQPAGAAQRGLVSSAGARSRTSPSSAPRASCCSTRTSPPARSPIATCASPGRARRPTGRRSPCAPARARRRRAPSTPAGTGRRSWRAGACSRGPRQRA